MQRYQVTLTGQTDILMHHDNLPWADAMKKWHKDPSNKKTSVAGDDRTPAWGWIGYLYVEGGRIVLPSDNIMTVLREGGKKVPTGKGQETFSRYTQSGIVVDQSSWALLIDGAEIPYQPIKELINNNNFEAHVQTVENMGFELFVKRAKINTSKHVRVRPRFSNWSASGTVTVLADDIITKEILESVLLLSGAYCGLCDWRPSSPKAPGQFGRFTAKVTKL